MANEKPYPTWELLGLIIGFVGSANLVPDLVNLVLNLYDKPCLRAQMFFLKSTSQQFEPSNMQAIPNLKEKNRLKF